MANVGLWYGTALLDWQKDPTFCRACHKYMDDTQLMMRLLTGSNGNSLKLCRRHAKYKLPLSMMVPTHPNMYRKLNIENREARLVFIHPSAIRSRQIVCELYHMSLNDPPPYVALSYVWGDASRTRTIMLDGEIFSITSNLHEAMLQLRQETDVLLLWIDAICIDQSNIEERSQQVSLMREIYTNALLVTVWLGPETNNSHLAVQLIHTWSQAMVESTDLDSTSLTDEIDFSFLSHMEEPFPKNAWNAVLELFERPWWTRIWVIQEVAVSKKASFLCGSDIISLAEMLLVTTFWQALRDMESSTPLDLKGQISVVRFQEHLLHFVHAWQYASEDSSSEKVSIVDLLHQTQHYGATDPRDKIFALLGIDQVHDIPIKPDYSKPVEIVYTEATSAIIKAKGNLGVTRTAGIGIIEREILRSPLTLDVPSWVPDFRARYTPSVSIRNSLSTFNASKDTKTVPHFSSDLRTLYVSGIICDLINGVEWPEPEDSVMGRFAKLALDRPYTHPTGIPQHQAFFRTLILDSSGFGYGKPEFTDEEAKQRFFELVVGFMRYAEYLGPENRLESPDSLILHQYPADLFLDTMGSLPDPSDGVDWSLQWNDPKIGILSHFARWCRQFTGSTELDTLESVSNLFLGRPGSKSRIEWPDLDLSDDENDQLLMRFAKAIAESICYRSCFITPKGYMGVGPEGTQLNDLICVPYGSDIPWVIRPQEGCYLLVGECYVYGMMNGEMLDEVQHDRLVVERLAFR